MSDKGRFITVEGQDGAGKSTNIQTVIETLSDAGIECLETREPGGTPLGEALRGLLLERDQFEIAALPELLMMFAARAQHLQSVIKPALAEGVWVVCDRFTDASYAYQGGGRELPFSDIDTLKTLVQGNLTPDLTLILDVPPEIGLARTDQRGERDRFEIENIEFKQRVRDAYLAIAGAEPNRVALIDASQPLSTVHTRIKELLAQRFEL